MEGYSEVDIRGSLLQMRVISSSRDIIYVDGSQYGPLQS